MLKHLYLKVFALICAAIFWAFVVSLENNFYKLPEPLPIEVFSKAPEFALASKLGSVSLTVRSQDSDIFRTLAVGDFQAYVDLRTVGAGRHKLPVSVTSKNSAVSVMKIEPVEVEVELSPVREKVVSVKAVVAGQPAKGFKLESVKLERENVEVRGAESILAEIASVKAEVVLNGTEKQTFNKTVSVVIYNKKGEALSDLEIKQKELSALATIVEVETEREIGMKAKITGSLTNGVVKSITLTPPVISVRGKREILEAITVLETEVIDLKGVQESFERKVKVTLPAGVTLAEGQSLVVTVKVEIEKQE